MNHDFPLSLSFDDVLLVPQYSEINSRAEVDLSTKISPNLSLKIPIISVNMDTVTGVDMAIKMGQLGGMGILPRFDTPEVQAEKVSKVKNAGVIVSAAVGCKDGFMDRARMLVEAGASVISLDVAHGHMRKSLDATSALKNEFDESVTIISGVVATYEGARDLFQAGADSVRVGLGPGTICTTRIMTGFGVPQISALLEAKRAAQEAGKTILADGGTKNSGDIVKALAAGGVAVVVGSQLAGTDEAPGAIIEKNGKKYKEYNGSTSEAEKKKQVEKYSQDKGENYVVHVEGVEAMVPYKGPLELHLEKILAGVRSGFSYAGARNIYELWDKAKFIRVTSGGIKENGAHDVFLR